jgi:flagellar basal body-associated protein FliL
VVNNSNFNPKRFDSKRWFTNSKAQMTKQKHLIVILSTIILVLLALLLLTFCTIHNSSQTIAVQEPLLKVQELNINGNVSFLIGQK